MPEDIRETKLLSLLQQHLIERDIRAGFALLEQAFVSGCRLSPQDPDAFSLLLCLAQWIDLGYGNLELLERQLTYFQQLDLLKLSVLQFTQWKLSTAFHLLACRDLTGATEAVETALRIAGPAMPPSERFIAHFWACRTLRQAGEFERALAEVRSAKESALQLGASKLVAVTKIHESWLLFHQGERHTAFQLLDEAEQVLRPTEHRLSLGNIEAARGRFVRSTGDYQGALRHFEKAISIYREHNPEHLNLGRALVNAAYVKRLIALDLRPRLRGEPASSVTNAQALRVAQEAMELLETASSIYARHQHASGSGSVLVNLGHLQLESGDIEAAAEQGRAAFHLGESKGDVLIMARARILQAYAHLAWSEEEMDREPGTAHPAHLAGGFAEEAITLAERTENRRLLAGAYITRGLVAIDEHYGDRETARIHAAKASQLLGGDDHDHLARELGALKLKIMRSAALNDTLRQWADGETGGKTFQQIEEEFAEIVIPRVWLKLGQNASLVAQQLSISPKKVRRILRNAQVART